MGAVSITAPATTANLGPGFDCLGIALELSNNVQAVWEETRTFEGSVTELAALLQQETKFQVSGEGEGEIGRPALGLFFRSLAKLLILEDVGGVRPLGLHLAFVNQIPFSRGLGSSAACIVSALALARAILGDVGRETTKRDLLVAAIELEGHADNVLPALYGGARLSVPGTGPLPLSFSLPIVPQLDLVLAIPELRVSTAKARDILPGSVPLDRAVENSARLAGLILALGTGDFTALRQLIQGSFHVPYRAQLIPGYDQVEKAAYQQGAAAFTISGAGPSVLALSKQNSDEIGAAMVDSFNKAGFPARYFVSGINGNGVLVDKLC